LSFEQTINIEIAPITPQNLQTIVSQLQETSPEEQMVLFIDPMFQSDRHLYAKSPFRKATRLRDRIDKPVPADVDMLAFALPDDNHSDSSKSE
jgi:hypothetical protein